MHSLINLLQPIFKFFYGNFFVTLAAINFSARLKCLKASTVHVFLSPICSSTFPIFFSLTVCVFKSPTSTVTFLDFGVCLRLNSLYSVL